MNHAYDTDPLFNIPQDYPPERSAWDAANTIEEFLETANAEDLPDWQLNVLQNAVRILRKEAEK